MSDIKYQNLHELIQRSSSSREYFLSLPVDTQLRLHVLNDYIHSLHQLHIYAEISK
ncbi:MAG: hypothetical protein E7H80_08480 [Thomasclavelia ramosa]|uniref:hypothetical protein n=1 Tax=Thomasclavelia ramosa TaxID=1547 RepID=UPI001C38E777|nr:hypothetical protein [Thomasclavelia ramosa]MDU4087270.1 hypothetical protein [Thomasclavelia ramosa]